MSSAFRVEVLFLDYFDLMKCIQCSRFGCFGVTWTFIVLCLALGDPKVRSLLKSYNGKSVPWNASNVLCRCSLTARRASRLSSGSDLHCTAL